VVIDWARKPLVALLAVAFAAIAAGAWGSTTGPGTTGNGGDDPAGVADPVQQIQMPPVGQPQSQGQVPQQMPSQVLPHVSRPPTQIVVPPDAGSYDVVAPPVQEDEGAPGSTP
jgi:hypothetical protein